MPTAYKGEVEVEDSAFTVEFERFIIGENCVAFEGDGHDDDGKFHFEGRGAQDDQGQYRINPWLRYREWSEGAIQGTIVIEELHPSKSGKKCTVRGHWIQDEYRWSIFGKLSLFGT